MYMQLFDARTRSYYLKIVEELKICVLYLSAQHESDIPTVYMYVYVHAYTFTSKLNLHTHAQSYAHCFNFCCPIIPLSSCIDSPEKTASYSLYVVGSNGVLTEHVLQPQKLSSAADGEDAPIELTRFPKTAWRLMGYVSTHTCRYTDYRAT